MHRISHTFPTYTDTVQIVQGKKKENKFLDIDVSWILLAIFGFRGTLIWGSLENRDFMCVQYFRNYYEGIRPKYKLIQIYF